MNKGDKRILTQDLVLRTAYSISRVPKGEIIKIQSADNDYHKVLVENCWVHDSVIEKVSIPVKEVNVK